MSAYDLFRWRPVTDGRCQVNLLRHFLLPVLGSSRSLAIQDKLMAKLSKETKQRLQQLFQCGQFVIRWGFIPTVLYLGFKRGADPGMPEPTVLSLLWG
ncbi:mitochondrial import receptor subunit TOM7 homolog [Stegastes partitus]|uniref:Mitochondrial import receptor subunit TOM7 homolog n=1 Tax=Stegastes partitus TaxID=144197 RepID=A0A9Y4TRK8_9TELE|nr:PREDICTED: mitochondrial import receptor subunit TOM7 homolog [Stegastes partitus]